MNYTKTRICKAHDIDKTVREISQSQMRDDVDAGNNGQIELINVALATYRDYDDSTKVIVSCLFKD